MTRHNKSNYRSRNQNQKATPKPKRTTPGNHHRSQAVVLSSVYLFTPLLFVPPIAGVATVKPVVSAESSASFLDVLDGMGGPAEVPMRTLPPLEMLENALVENDSQFSIFAGNSIGPETTITKVYNYLKVADTVMPTTSPEITSDYGWRTPPCRGCSSDHKGIDFVPGFGEPIFAVADGMVIDMGRNGGYGNYVKLRHLMANSEGVMEEWVTLYAHMKNDSFPEGMKVGSAVKSGETIGAVGNTGMSTGAHLHFELTINGEHVDPMPLLGTYQVIIVTEEEYPDYMFVGEKFRAVETVITYE